MLYYEKSETTLIISGRKGEGIMKKIYVGAAYYPEMWEESEVDRDIVRMKEAGVNVVRVAEFAWGKMEPEEGKFDFGWLERVVDKLYKAGIDVIMCTPTCTPPRWMLDKYPETRSIGAYPETRGVFGDGKHVEVFSRCHPCKTSPVMREKNRIIVTELAKAFGKHPGVIGWQIDNEIFPYNEGCYCPLCRSGFRAYLKEKYGTPENLNAKWGMQRWSLEYKSFDDVLPPVRGRWEHPSLQTEWTRFHCKNIVSYVNEQAEILHKYTSVPVGTDMMATNLLSYADMNEQLDVAQFNHYEPAAELARITFCYDFLRTIKDKSFWVTETQVGWNGSTFADFGYRPAGACYANTWLPIARGGEMIEYWHFRAHPNGHELAHGSLFNTAGRAYRVTEEVSRAAAEFEKCRSLLTGSEVRSKIAIHYSSTAVINSVNAPMLKNYDYRSTLIDRVHAAFRHYNVDVIETNHALDGYDVLFSPFLSTVDEKGLKERVIEWVKAGGTWVVGPMSDIMTEYSSKYANAPYSFLEELAGVYTKYELPIANDVYRAKWAGGEGTFAISTCYSAYELKGAEALAVYENGEFAGMPVITQHRVGKGKVILLGTLPEADVLRSFAGSAPILPASDNLVLTARSGSGNAIIAVETENKSGVLVLDGAYKEMLSGRTLEGSVSVAPYEVLVLVKK